MTTTKTLGDVLEIRKGKKAAAVTDSEVIGSFPYIQIDEVRGGKPTKFAIDPNPVLATENDLCIVWDGANAGTVGYGVSGAVGSTVARMRLRNPQEWDTRFLGRLLQGKFLQLNAEAQGRGATIPHVDKARLEAIEFPAMPLSEQRRIVVILDKADAIRRKCRWVLGLADDFTVSLFQKMFGNSDWPTRTLADVVASDTSVTYGIVQAGPEVEGGTPYIRTGDIKNGKILVEGLRHTSPDIASKFNRSRVKAGDIVMSIRATVGTTAVVPPELEGANLTQGTARIAPGEHVTSAYLLSYLRSQQAQEWIEGQVKGATFREITLSRLRELPVPTPPITMQQEYCKLYHKAQGLASKMAADLSKSTELNLSLSQRAFSGAL